MLLLMLAYVNANRFFLPQRLAPGQLAAQPALEAALQSRTALPARQFPALGAGQLGELRGQSLRPQFVALPNSGRTPSGASLALMMAATSGAAFALARRRLATAAVGGAGGKHYQYLIIGGGSGGMATARRAKLYGANVCIVDKKRGAGRGVAILSHRRSSSSFWRLGFHL